jgi:hypothetical protein
MDFSPHNACEAKLQAKAELLLQYRVKSGKITSKFMDSPHKTRRRVKTAQYFVNATGINGTRLTYW